MNPNTTNSNIWSLAWPSISVYLIHTLAGLAVIKIVGELGTDAVAAVTAGTRVLFIMQAVMMGLGAGVTALIARAWGAGNRCDIALFTNLSLTTGSLIALLFTLLAIALAPTIAAFFKLTGQARLDTISYIRWTNLFNLCFSLNIVLATALRAVGDARTPLYITLLANLFYLPLATALTYGYWGLPAWGVKGTALGSGLAFALAALVALSLWFNNRLTLPFKPTGLAQMRPHFRRLWHIAYPAMAEQGIVQVALFAFLWLVSGYSMEAFAAYGIGLSLLSVTMVIGLGFSIAGSALVGQQLGAGNPRGALQAGYRALHLALLAMSLFGAVAIVWGEALAGLMVEDAEVIRLTGVFLFCLGLAQPLLAVDFALGGALRGAGDTRFPLLSTFCSFILTRLLLATVFNWLGLPVEWIFATLVADYFVKAALILGRYRSHKWLQLRAY